MTSKWKWSRVSFESSLSKNSDLLHMHRYRKLKHCPAHHNATPPIRHAHQLRAKDKDLRFAPQSLLSLDDEGRSQTDPTNFVIELWQDCITALAKFPIQSPRPKDDDERQNYSPAPSCSHTMVFLKSRCRRFVDEG